MKEDIRKKFIDILFEPEEDEEPVVEVEAPMEDLLKKNTVSATVKAQDILYKKPKSTAFVTLVEDTNKNKMPSFDEEKKDYVLKQNISPMFGLVDKKEEEEPIKVEQVITPLPKSNKTSSYLGTIISPYYGYDVKNDYSNTMNLSINKIEEESDKVDHLTDDFNNLIEETKQEAREIYVKKNDILNDANDNIFYEEEPVIDFKAIEEPEPVFDDYQEIDEEPIVDDVIEEVGASFNQEAYECDESFNEIDFEDYRSYDEPVEEFHFGNTEEIDLFKDIFEEDKD